MANSRKYTRLRNIILAMTLCFAILPTLAVGIFIPAQFIDLYHEKIFHETESLAISKAATIDIFLKEHLNQLRILTENVPYNLLCKQEKLEELVRSINITSPNILDISVVDQEGNLIQSSEGKNHKNINYKDEVWFKRAITHKESINDVFLDKSSAPRIVITVLSSKDKGTFLLRATINSARFTDLVQSTRLSEDGDIFVINKANELQNTSKLFGPILTKVTISWPNTAVETSEEQVSGSLRLLSKAKLNSAPWVLVVSEASTTYDVLIKEAQWYSIAGVAFAIAAIISCICFVTRILISRLERADKEKAAYDASLLQANKMGALGKMAEKVAYEINNPLTLVKESADWISDMLGDESPDKIQHYAEIQQATGNIERNVNRASDIIHLLLGFAHPGETTPSSLPLNPIINQAIAFLKNEAKNRNIEICKDLTSQEPRVSIDVLQLQRVLLNVLNNALEAVNKNGVIAITSKIENEYAVVIISDTGPGISDELMEQIFDPFVTTKIQGEGVGLGLSVCYSIIQGLGGSVEASNIESGGATITIKLPHTPIE